MDSKSENNKRIAKNTFLLYLRMLFTMGVNLYTSRIVLNTLGVEDFGIYNVVGGVVAMFSVLSGSLSAAISRFITFELGKGDIKRLMSVFSSSMTIQFLIAGIIFLLAESCGVWFLNTHMNISLTRMSAANWVLQCSIFTFVVNLISVPYNAVIVAHEKMSAFAYISILEAFLKLVAIYLLVIFSFDKLKLYAILLLLISLVIRFIYSIYCKHHFEECIYYWKVDKPLLKEMVHFAGWNFIGASSSVLRDQGVNIILNLFCGPIVNAARGIAFQVNNAINNFTVNFMLALNPQITKSYASNDFKYMMHLIEQGARFSFYMLLLLSLPVLIETNYVLTLWLKTVPDYTVCFVRLVLIFTMWESLSGTLITAMLATGRIRNYQIVVGGLQLLNFPISYLLLLHGSQPECTLWVAIVLSIICLFVRVLMLSKMIGLSFKSYFRNVLQNVLIVALVASILPVSLTYIVEAGFFRLLYVCILSLMMTVTSIYVVGLSQTERNIIKVKFQKFILWKRRL